MTKSGAKPHLRLHVNGQVEVVRLAIASETPAQAARRELLEAGVSVSEWARMNGFSRHAVVDVLRGRSLGHRGNSHRIAVALGLKTGRVVDLKTFKPARSAA